MIAYAILFAASVAGIAVLAYWHRQELFYSEAGFAGEREPSFAVFMDGVWRMLASFWHTHFRESILLFIEKRLRWTRIIVLKIERFLFRTTHRIRGISERGQNGNGSMNANGNAGDNNNNINKPV